MTEKRCHICEKEVRENYYLDKRGYTCYICSKAIANKKNHNKKDKGGFKMTENVRVCVLNARKSKKRFCSYLNDDFDCTAPIHQYDYCIGFLKRLNGGF